MKRRLVSVLLSGLALTRVYPNNIQQECCTIFRANPYSTVCKVRNLTDTDPAIHSQVGVQLPLTPGQKSMPLVHSDASSSQSNDGQSQWQNSDQLCDTLKTMLDQVANEYEAKLKSINEQGASIRNTDDNETEQEYSLPADLAGIWKDDYSANVAGPSGLSPYADRTGLYHFQKYFQPVNPPQPRLLLDDPAVVQLQSTKDTIQSAMDALCIDARFTESSTESSTESPTQSNRADSEPSTLTIQDDKYKTVLCTHQLNKQHCFMGDKCRFAHSIDEVRKRNPKYKTKPCIRFIQDGYCPFGIKCRYIHGAKEFLNLYVLSLKKQ